MYGGKIAPATVANLDHILRNKTICQNPNKYSLAIDGDVVGDDDDDGG